MERRVVTEEIEWTLNTFCRDCFVRDAFKKDYGKNYAQSFCNRDCSVGQRLQALGESLMSKSVEK
ncbi:zinc-finger domain-containing protein [Bacillus sp. Marseille-Q3570]|uniref:zinc-finger domain-containing protein n=1 Tax=Bacillales TaxID=1385 RepID=UPI0021B7F3A9|nr:zinc-finger domain-containing protein [Bacillus sp. Marseille-Q3570]